MTEQGTSQCLEVGGDIEQRQSPTISRRDLVLSQILQDTGGNDELAAEILADMGL